MAIAYQSIGSTAFTSINSATPAITITKPTNLAAGDLMLAIIGVLDFNMGGQADAVTGWTYLGDVTEGSNFVVVYSKIADASDASASDFSFTLKTGNTGGANDYVVGSILRISGTSPVTGTSFCSFSGDADGGTTNSYAGGVDPLVADQLLVMCVAGVGATTTVSNYAITTSNPTWTERQDANVNDTTDYTFAIATAPRSQSTATGVYTADFASSVTASVGILVAVIEATNVTVSPSVVTMTANIVAPSVAGNANVTVSAAISITASVQAPAVTTAANPVANLDKSSAPSWVNQDKS